MTMATEEFPVPVPGSPEGISFESFPKGSRNHALERMRATGAGAKERVRGFLGLGQDQRRPAPGEARTRLAQAKQGLSLHVEELTRSVLDGIKDDLVHRIESIELEFGLKLQTGLDIPMLVEGDEDASMKVKLTIKPT